MSTLAAQRCRHCKDEMELNGGFQFCPHCDRPCFRSRPGKRCESCKRGDEAEV